MRTQALSKALLPLMYYAVLLLVYAVFCWYCSVLCASTAGGGLCCFGLVLHVHGY